MKYSYFFMGGGGVTTFWCRVVGTPSIFHFPSHFIPGITAMYTTLTVTTRLVALLDLV